MSPEQFEEEMRKYHESDDDAEDIHINMEYLMCHLLRNLGYGKGIDIFENTMKYYS